MQSFDPCAIFTMSSLILFFLPSYTYPSSPSLPPSLISSHLLVFPPSHLVLYLPSTSPPLPPPPLPSYPSPSPSSLAVHLKKVYLQPFFDIIRAI